MRSNLRPRTVLIILLATLVAIVFVNARESVMPTFEVIAGGVGRGFAGDGGPATRAALFDPVGVAVDPSGNLLIADSNNGVIREVARDNTIRTIKVTNDSAGVLAPSRSRPAPGLLYMPTGIVVNQHGILYVTETMRHWVRMIDPDGESHVVAGTGNPGFSGDGGLGVNALLTSPSGLAAGQHDQLHEWSGIGRG